MYLSPRSRRMSSEPGFRSEQVCLLWNAKKPYCYGESPVFTVQRCEYKVSLRLVDDGYDLDLLREDGELLFRSPFDTTVCIVRGSTEYLKQKADVFTDNGCIWSARIPELREVLPDFEERRFLLFRMIFSTDDSPVHVSLSTTPVKEQKSVQTPIHWVTDPCLSLDFRRLLDGHTNPRPDVELKCGDNVSLQAHGSVLGARSEVFSRMLQTDMVEARTGLVEVGDMDSRYFAEFLKYVYTGILPELTTELAKALYEAGDKYAVGNLTTRCGDFLSENMTPDNVLEYLALADAHNDPDFKEKAMAYVLDKKIPLQDDRWLPFLREHTTIAAEVLQRGFKSLCRESTSDSSI